MSSAPQAPLPDRKARRGVALWSFRTDESGLTAVMAALTAPLLLGLAALGAEGSYAYFKHASMQSVADMAALSAVSAMKAGGGKSGAILEATSVAAQMGYVTSPDDTGTMKVEVNIPPVEGPQKGNASATEVILTLSQEPMLTRVFRDERYTIRARTVGIVPGIGGCMLALDATANGAISAGGTTVTTLNNCSVYSNSSSSQSINTNGGGSITAAEFNVVGSTAGSGLYGPNSSPPVIKTSSQAMIDPYKSIPSPASASGYCPNTNPGMVNSDATLSPGYYCSGLSLKKGVITLKPGVYVIVGGSFQVGSGVTLKGEGVTIITAMYNYYIYTMSISSGANVTLSAPTSGPYAGVALFADRSIPASAKINNSIQGGSTQNITGAIYMPTSDLTYAGGATANNGCTQLIAKTITINGNSTLSANCEGSGTAFIGTQSATVLTD